MADKRIIDLGDRSVAADDYLEIDGLTNGSARLPVGRAGGPPILDAAGKITDRLAYEGAAGGVATLDAAGKLAQPRRLLNIYGASGITTTWSTTNAVGVDVLPDPQITVPAIANSMMLINAQIMLYSDTGGKIVFARLMRSTDGGATWTGIGIYQGATAPSASYRMAFSLTAMDAPGVSGDVLYGISLGTASGDAGTFTIYTHSSYRAMTVLHGEV